MKSWLFGICLLILSSSLSASPVENPKDTTVYLFLLHDCVICQAYAPIIQKLYEDNQSKFNFVAIYPHFVSKKEDIESFQNEYGLSLPYKTDYYKQLSNKFSVSVTPTAVVVDNLSGQILYHGRIDDEFVSIGVRRSVVHNEDLRNALIALKSGMDYIKKTDAIGCIINFEELKN